MTSEQKVKKVYPDARIVYGPFRATVVSGGHIGDPLPQVFLGERLGFNRCDRQAWANAWRRIQAQQTGGGNG